MKSLLKTIISFTLLAIIGISVSCESKKTQKPYSFYHWKTLTGSTSKINQHLKAAGSDKLYLRFFDLHVDKNSDHVFPTATIQFDPDFEPSISQVIPVIYIKNEVFQHSDSEGGNMRLLVDNVASKLKRLITANLADKEITEVQIDCDWTDGTRERYFDFLNQLKASPEFQSLVNSENSNITRISCTIRWHQVKYRERTGVPPVDRGVIMAYNVGDLGDVKESNSIINNEITENYINRLEDYPLEYDVALPLFEWIVQYRDAQIIGIHSDMDQTFLDHNTSTTNDPSIFKVEKEFNTADSYFYVDDVLRYETVEYDKLLELAQLIKNNSSQDYQTIFYHVNSLLLEKFTHEQLSKISM